MRDIVLNAASSKSVVHCGAGAYKTNADTKGQKYIVTDSNVYALYKELIDAFCAPVCVLKAGEESKTHTNLFGILEDMLDKGMRRSCTVVAFGGGVVGDIAGLAASLYMRGTSLVQIPTTLLAQVDSSVGGKTAVDLGKVKNAVGSFYQPREVIVDPMFLRTLPAREINCGLGEIIKYGAIDGGIYKKLINAEDIYDFNFLEEITFDCIEHKARVVQEDERDEKGLRKTLNLGHTTGHAFELLYGGMSHGEFVLAGTFYELYIAGKRGICGGQYAENLKNLIKKVIKLPAYENIKEAAKLAAHDKKNTDSLISIIAPATEGRCAEIKLERDEYRTLLEECAKKIREGAV